MARTTGTKETAMAGMEGLDPELAELMALEEAERAGSGFSPAGAQDPSLDPELAELMAQEEAERAESGE